MSSEIFNLEIVKLLDFFLGIKHVDDNQNKDNDSARKKTEEEEEKVETKEDSNQNTEESPEKE